jgi:hypothetical protein
MFFLQHETKRKIHTVIIYTVWHTTVSIYLYPIPSVLVVPMYYMLPDYGFAEPKHVVHWHNQNRWYSVQINGNSGVSDCVHYHCNWNNTPGWPKQRLKHTYILIWINLIAAASLGCREMNSRSGLLLHLLFLTVLLFQVTISITFFVTIWTSNYHHI